MINADMVPLLRHGIRSFFAWWLGELRGLMPKRLRPAGRGRRQVELTWSEGELCRVVVEDGATGEADRLVPLDNQEILGLHGGRRRQRAAVVLRLREDQGLRKVIDLPLAAMDDMEQLLNFEMDRLTPFRADEVYFAHRILETNRERRRMSVELQVTPKAVVDRALAPLEELGVQVSRVELPGPHTGGRPPLDLSPRRGGELRAGSRLNRALGLAALLLCAIAIIIPLQQQRITAADLERRVATARAEAEESLALRERLDELTASARFVVERKANEPMITRALAELTRRIPDQAHVGQLHVQDGTIQLHGYAETASELIGALAQSPLFREPQFRSPVTRDPREERERFHISVELAPGDA